MVSLPTCGEGVRRSWKGLCSQDDPGVGASWKVSLRAIRKSVWRATVRTEPGARVGTSLILLSEHISFISICAYLLLGQTFQWLRAVRGHPPRMSSNVLCSHAVRTVFHMTCNIQNHIGWVCSHVLIETRRISCIIHSVLCIHLSWTTTVAQTIYHMAILSSRNHITEFNL